MGKRIGITAEGYIRLAALPVHAASYSVIPHGEIIDAAKELLDKYNLSIDKELYSANQEAEVAKGIYHLKGSGDPELSMIFAWVNSYDKSKRFSCAIGSVIKDYGYYLSGDLSSFKRKHTGTAKQEAIDAMEEQITNAGKYYGNLLSNMTEMKLVKLPENLRASILGRLLFKERLLTLEQSGIIKSLLMKPGGDDSLWELNKYISSGLLKSHPREWLEAQLKISEFLNKEFRIGQGKITGQINLLDVISEVEAEKAKPKEEINFEL